MSGNKIYIGNLPPRCDERDIEDFLRGFGRIKDIRLMNKFAFVVFDDPRDARDAVYDLHGRTMLGERVVVEFAKSDGPRDRRSREDDRNPRPLRYERPRHTSYRAFVEGLSNSANWQDLKDLARTVGKVTFADCHRPREGLGEVEFEYPEDLDDFVRKVDGMDFKGSVLTVKRDSDAKPFDDGRDGYGGPAPRGRSRSPGYRRGPPPPRDYRGRDDDYDRRSPPHRGGRSPPSPPRRGGGRSGDYDDRPRSRSPPRRDDRDDRRVQPAGDARYDDDDDSNNNNNGVADYSDEPQTSGRDVDA